MNLEDSIKDEISKKLEDGTVERIVAERFEKSITSAVDELMGNYGEITKIIKNNVKDVMIPYLENRDYSEYITKLDSVLVEILKSTTFDNKKMLENFKNLMTPDDFEGKRTIALSEIWEQWKKYVAEKVDTSGLDVNCEDGEATYEPVEVTLIVEENEKRAWSDIKHATVLFECEHDESLNVELHISNWSKFDGGKWDIEYKGSADIASIRYLNDFQIFMMKLTQHYIKLELDITDEEDEVEPEAEPEASYS